MQKVLETIIRKTDPANDLDTIKHLLTNRNEPDFDEKREFYKAIFEALPKLVIRGGLAGATSGILYSVFSDYNPTASGVFGAIVGANLDLAVYNCRTFYYLAVGQYKDEQND